MSKKNNKSFSNNHEIQNAIKTLYANIRFLSPDNPVKTIAITSSVPNEGKSTIALNLAQAIAGSGKTVLLVDTDLRRRSLAMYLNLRAPSGLYAVLAKQVALNDAVMTTQAGNLFFLDAEAGIPNPVDILSSNRFKALVKTLREGFDYVVFDSPPLGPFVDAAIVGALVDGVVMVVRPRHTKRKDLLFAYDQLKKSESRILGACASYNDRASADSYYAYYTVTGHRVRDKYNEDGAYEFLGGEQESVKVEGLSAAVALDTAAPDPAADYVSLAGKGGKKKSKKSRRA
ncbi:MAG TPA: capsular biosynthesis protein [Coriobacteriia bacterium]|nr:capsular biosynthesis protein [Coriobacteriia bacterium]